MADGKQRWLEAFTANPDDDRAFAALEEQYFHDADWAALAGLYRARLRAPSTRKDAQAASALHFRLAQLLEERLHDIPSAIETYWAVLQIEPAHHRALRQLRRIHARSEDWKTALEIAQIEEAAEIPAYDRAAALAEVGEMWRVALADAEKAAACFERAIAIDASQIDALTGLARAREDQGRNAEAARAWQRVVDHQRGPDRAVALVRLGRLLGGALGDADRASECYRRALTDDPRSREAVEALVEHAERSEQWPLLVDLLERRFDLTAGARRRTDIALSAARIQLERLDNPAHARLWLARARELSPDDARVHLTAAAVERRAGNATALLRALEAAIAASADDEAGPPLDALVEAARLHAANDDDERAIEYLRAASARDASDPDVARELDRCLARLCRDADRVDVLEQRASLAATPRERAELLAEAAQLSEDVLEDADAATAVWGRAFDADPSHGEAAAQWMARLRKAERWDDVRDALERACEATDGRARVDHLNALGELALVRFDDAEGAARAFELALADDPISPRALEGLATIAETSGDDESILRAYAREADVTTDRRRLATLVWEIARIHEAHDRPGDALGWLARLREACPDDRACLEAIVRLHAVQADGAPTAAEVEALEALIAVSSGDARASACNRLAERLAALGRDDDAAQWLERSLETDPRQLEPTQRLVEHYRARGRHDRRARLQRRLADLLGPGDAQRACLLDLADLLETQLDDVDGAAVILWQVAGASDADDATRERLASLLERAGRHEELAQLLFERRRALVASGEPKALAAALDLELERARLLTQSLGRHEEAASAFRSVLESDPDSEAAAQGLEAALRADRDVAGLGALLLERAARARAAGDTARAVRLEFERAALFEDADDASERAREAYAQLADQDDDAAIATDARARLEALLERAGDYGALRALLERALERADDDAARRVLHERLAAVCRDRLSDVPGAIAHLEAAGAIEPARASIWRTLGLLYDDREHAEDLRRAIECELACDLAPDRIAALAGRAGALAREAGDAEAARAHYERLLAVEPGHAEASEFLIECYADRGDHDRLVALLEARIARTLDSAHARGEAARSQRTSLRLRLAALHADALGDLPAAIDVLRAAVDELGPDPIVASPLADVLQRADDGAALAALCRAVVDGGVAGTERAAWQLRLGDTLRAQGDADGAIGAYEGVDGASAEARAARAALCPLYRDTGRPAPLAALLETRLAEGRAGRDEQIALHRELAALHSDALARPSDALAHLRALLSLDPTDRAASRQAVATAAALGRSEDVDALLEIALGQCASPDERADVLVQRAELLRDALARPDDAAAALRDALAEAPHHLHARRALRDLHVAAGRWRAALDSLFVEARIAPADERRGLLEQGAELARERVSIDATLPWLERLRADDPGDAHTLERIADVHRHAGRPEALLRVVEQQIAIAASAPARARLHAERARVLERDLGAPGRALGALEAAHASDPNDAAVLRELARLRGALGRPRAQVEALEALCEVAPASERAALHDEAAALCAGELADPARAALHLERALEQLEGDAPADRRAALLRALADARRSEGRVGAWARASERELELVADDAARSLAVHQQLARAYEHELGASERALAHWDAVIERLAGASGAAAEAHADALDEAEEAGLRLAERLHDPVGLERRLARWLDRHEDDAARALALARIRSEVFHAPGAAAEAHRRALAADPESLEALRGLRDCAERLGRADEVAATLDRELALRPDAPPAERGGLFRRLGDVCAERLGDAERAAKAYRAAIALDAADLASLRALERICEAREEFDEALDLYERECAALGEREPARRCEAWLCAGAIARDFANDPARALAAYDAAASISALAPGDHLAWAALVRVSGDLARYCETFASWCDRPDGGARAVDHLRLADQLTELSRTDDALERTRRATACEPGSRDAWDALARREDGAQRRAAATEALERAAALSQGSEACSRWVAAALEIEPEDAARARALLRSAVAADPGAPWAHAHLARTAESVGDLDEALAAAGRALEGAGARGDDDAGHLDDALRLEAALVGGRAAAARESWESAAVFFGAALEIDPDSADALDGAASVLWSTGDVPGARELLERRLALDAPDPQRALHLAIVGEAFELAGRDGDAVERYREALAIDPALATAREGRIRALLRAGDASACVAEIEALADAAREPAEAARAHARAASVLLDATGDRDAARAHLELACELDPGAAEARAALAELRAEAGDTDAALALADEARAAADGDVPMLARIARLRAELLEARGRRGDAAEAWAERARLEPRDVAAALAHARLERAAGRWRDAADALARFAVAHPHPDDLELARVHEERARLLAGPLEDVDEAISAYEAALALDPERSEARAKLASLLALIPSRRRDAVAAHREILRRAPTHAGSLRSLRRMAEHANAEACALSGLAIARALGIATPEERERASVGLRTALARDARLDDPLRESLRRAVHEASDALAAVAARRADARAAAPETDGTSPLARAIATALGEIASPAVDRLDDAALAAALTALAALALDPASPHADGDMATALDAELGRRALRRVRKQLEGASLEAIAAIDAAAFRADLVALAGAIAVDRNGGDLRAALVALVQRTRPEARPADGDDLTHLVDADAAASRLLARVTGAWCERMTREI